MARKVFAAPAALMLITLPAGKIVIPEGWNRRGEKKKKPTDVEKESGRLSDEELYEDIKERGLDTPIRVTPIPQTDPEAYLLVAGFRRQAACNRISPEYPMVCTVQPVDQRDALGLRLTNLQENFQREDLTLYEKAEAFHELHTEHKLSSKKIADRTGFHPNYVANLIRYRVKIIPELWETIRKLGNSVNGQVLATICVLPPDQQIAAWRAAISGKAKAKEKAKERRQAKKSGGGKGKKSSEGAESSGEGEGAPEGMITAFSRAESALAILADPDSLARRSEAWKAGADHALKYVTSAIAEFGA